VIHGIASIAVPLHLSSGQPAAIAVLYIPHKVNQAKVAKALSAAANRICAVMG
jgi:DNA-binding IclR family transcriptional regulator